MNTIKENNTLNYSEYAYQLGNFFYSKKNSGEEKSLMLFLHEIHILLLELLRS